MIIGTLALSQKSVRGATDSGAMSNPNGCSFNGPVLLDQAGSPAKLQSTELMRRVVSCVAPRLPALAKSMRLNGTVQIEVLVNEAGHVTCARAINGHPILIGSAIEAARQWTFRPIKHGKKPVAFYGYVPFRYSTETITENVNPCLLAHW